MKWLRSQHDPWQPQDRYNGLSEYEFNLLAGYNSERGRGITHTPLWQAEMARLQATFDQGRRDQLIREGWTELLCGWLDQEPWLVPAFLLAAVLIVRPGGGQQLSWDDRGQRSTLAA